MLEASKSHTVMQRRMEHFSTFLQRITRLGKTWCPSHLISSLKPNICLSGHLLGFNMPLVLVPIGTRKKKGKLSTTYA